mgnify:CR=1 FL=1
MIKALHHPFFYPFFRVYTRWKIRRCFSGVFIDGHYSENNLPVLMIVNHFSWWDGFWAEYLNLKLFRRKYHFMMLEKELRSNMFLNKTGGYSINRGSRSVIESLDYTASLLSDSGNIVLMFPQGKFESMHLRDFRFEKGVEYVLKKVKTPVQIIFVVNLIEYYSNQKPLLTIHFREYNDPDRSSEALEREFNRFYSAAVGKNIASAPSS